MEDWFLRVANLEQVTITQTADINELQSIVSDLEAAVVGNVNLSLLLINTDKDWLGYDITHIGDLGVDGDITVGGSITPDADSLSDLGTTTNRFKSARIRQAYVDGITISGYMSIPGLISAPLRPQVANTLDLGSSYYKWRNLYLQGDVITDGLIDGVDIANSINQGVKTTDSPSFNQITLNDSSAQLRSNSPIEFKNTNNTGFQPGKMSSLKFSTDSNIRLDSHTNQLRIINEDASTAKQLWIGGGAGMTISHAGIISSGGLISSGDINLATGGNIKVNNANPRRTIFIPSEEIVPTMSSGCDSPTVSYIGVNQTPIKTVNFSPTSINYGRANFLLPDSYDGNQIIIYLLYTCAVSGTVFFRSWGRMFKAGDTLDDATFDSPAGMLKSVGANVLVEHGVNLTFANASEHRNYAQIQLCRLATDAQDTCPVPAQVIGIVVEFGVLSYSD